MIAGSHTLGNECRDFVEWHRGRTPYVLWALDLDLPAVRERVARAAGHLGDWLLAGYLRQPHVTLDLCGFPADTAAAADEFSLPALEASCRTLAERAPRPFAIDIGGLGSFCTAPFLEVADTEGGIAALRRALAVDGHNRSKNDYLPHVTVGLYADAWPAVAVNARLRQFFPGPALGCRIESLTLFGYRPQEIGGELQRLGEFCLRRREMRWHCRLTAGLGEIWR